MNVARIAGTRVRRRAQAAGNATRAPRCARNLEMQLVFLCARAGNTCSFGRDCADYTQQITDLCLRTWTPAYRAECSGAKTCKYNHLRVECVCPGHADRCGPRCGVRRRAEPDSLGSTNGSAPKAGIIAGLLAIRPAFLARASPHLRLPARSRGAIRDDHHGKTLRNLRKRACGGPQHQPRAQRHGASLRAEPSARPRTREWRDPPAPSLHPVPPFEQGDQGRIVTGSRARHRSHPRRRGAI
jgi:hypothetical protein